MYFTCVLVPAGVEHPSDVSHPIGSTPGIDSAPLDGMTDRESERPPAPGPIEGADAAALGTDAAPASAPPGATVDDSEHLVPGAKFGEGPKTASKPWFTSLGAESEQAGVANDDPDAQEPVFPDDTDAREP
jgi:hypothetical protein